MKIEVWSDFVCPFCYMGKRRLEEALKAFDSHEDINMIYYSFELDPEARDHYEEKPHELLAKKYQITPERAHQMNQQIIEQAAQLGLNYKEENMGPTNTFAAHQLQHFAQDYRLAKEMTERLFKAHFVEGRDLSDLEVLSELAEQIGLDRDKAREALKKGQYADCVRQDEKRARELGVDVVPYFVFNQKYVVTGAQSIDIFLQAIEKASKKIS